MGASITVNMNTQALNTLTQAQIIACKKTAMKMLAEKVDAQEIPMDQGTLQNVYTDVDDSAARQGLVRIATKGPYAARLYYNPQYNFNQTFNTNAKGEWWEDFLTGSKKDRPHQLYAYFYRQATGGVVQ
jgi:hypothetical protein